MQAEGRLRKLLLLAIYTVFYKGNYFNRADNDLSEIRTSINGKITFFVSLKIPHDITCLNYFYIKNDLTSVTKKNVVKIISNKLLTVFYYSYSTHRLLSKI